jgi:hypothetical protein
MKSRYFRLLKLFVSTMMFFNLAFSRAQTIILNQEFEKDTIIQLFSQIDKAFSFKISGTSILKSDTSLVRVVLEDIDGNRILIYETYNLISLDDTIKVLNGCDESCYLKETNPSKLYIDVINATFRFDSLMLTTFKFDNPDSLQSDLNYFNDSVKISTINKNIVIYDKYWRAGRTSFSDWSYQQKEEFFGRKYNLFGLDYYKGGVFELKSSGDYTKETSQYVSSYNWRNRHGANNPLSPYFDGDNQYFTGWITPVEDQESCNTCYIFATTAAVETRLNLYYNIHHKINSHHFDYYISEQDVWKCGTDLNISCDLYGTSEYAYDRLQSQYRCTDEYYNYHVSAGNNCEKPGNPDGEIRINGSQSLFLYSGSWDAFKLNLIKSGPVTGYIPNFPNGAHYVEITGFETGTKGLKVYCKKFNDDTDIVLKEKSAFDGALLCHFKNSYGLDWGDNGFGILPIEDFTSVYYTTGPLFWENHIHDPNSSATAILCSDEDGDGYYWWGTSQQTPCASCPEGISNMEDCDDSNRDLGPYSASYDCISNCDTETGFLSPTGNYFVNVNTRIKKDIQINSGCTVTVNSTLYMAPEKKIIVKIGGKLIINGNGKITSSCNQLWQGIEVIGSENLQNVMNQGVCLVNPGGVIENAICGIKTIPLFIESGAIINANGAIFKNNKTAVYFSKYSKNYDPILTKLENCQFETSEILSDGSSPIELVRLENLSNANCLTFKGCTFRQIGNQKIATGINAFNSFFKCINNNTIKTTFHNLYYCIYGICSTPVSPIVIIDNCEFDSSFKAIYISGLTAPQITRNIINIPSSYCNFIPVDGFTAYGLYLDASTAYKVEENTFFCDQYTDQIPNYIKTCGVYIRNSGAYANEIYLNIFANLNYAVAAYGRNRNGINEGLQIKCNTFIDCATDIGIYKGTSEFTEDIGIRMDQGDYNTSNPSSSAGNVFTSISFQYHIKDVDNASGNSLRYNHYNYSSIPTNLRMIPSQNLSPNIGIHENFQSYFNYILSCPSRFASGPNFLSSLNSTADSLLSMVDSTSFILKQNVDDGDTPGTINLILASPIDQTYSVYNDLINKSPFLSNSAMTFAVEREELLPPYMLRDILVANPHSAKSDSVFNALENRFVQLNDTLMGEIMANYEIVDSKEQTEISRAEFRQKWGLARNNIFTEMLSDSTQILSDSILKFYSKSDLIIDQYKKALHYASIGNFENAEEVLNGINTSGFNLDRLSEHLLFEEWINFIYNFSLLDSLSTLDSLQINLLYKIISADPNYNTIAAVCARNELIMTGYLGYIEPLDFNSEQKSERVRKQYPIYKSNETNRCLIITPNPAYDFVKIEYEIPYNCNEAVIMISDIYGTKIKQIAVYSNKNDIMLDLKSFKNKCLVVSLLFCDKSKISRILLIK